jgi:hypothetical protein
MSVVPKYASDEGTLGMTILAQLPLVVISTKSGAHSPAVIIKTYLTDEAVRLSIMSQ